MGTATDASTRLLRLLLLLGDQLIRSLIRFRLGVAAKSVAAIIVLKRFCKYLDWIL
jgi:hypothetical protein